MKIAFIGQKGLPAKVGGIEKYVENVAVRMAESGHEVYVYVRNNYTAKNIKRYQKIHLIHLPSIGTKHLDAITHTFLASVHSLFGGYDVINFQGIGPSFLSWIPKSFLPKTLVIATFHYQDYYHKKWNAFARMCLRMGEYVTCTVPDKTIAVNKLLALRIKQKYQSEAVVIPNGNDITYSEQVDAISQWGLKDKKYILSVGRLQKYRGINYLIDAFKQLEDTAQTTNNFKLVIVGDQTRSPEYMEYLKTISQGRSNIVFAGMPTGEPLEQLFSHAYLFVQPSETEESSVALLEAMLYGLTPLVSDTKENIEYVGEDGFYFDSKSVENLRDKLTYLLARNDITEEFGKRAKAKAGSEYSWDSVTQKTLDIYQQELELLKKKAQDLNSKKIA